MQGLSLVKSSSKIRLVTKLRTGVRSLSTKPSQIVKDAEVRQILDRILRVDHAGKNESRPPASNLTIIMILIELIY